MAVGLHSVTCTPPGGVAVDLSCLVDSVSIVQGRDDPGSQPEAAAATIELTTDAASELPADVDVGATIDITTTAGALVSTRFTGRVTDLTLGWEEAGADTPDMGAGQIVAVGTLGDLGRRVVGAVPFPQELDGARVARVMAAAGISLDPLFSDPGTVELLARDIDAQPALEVARAAAVDASGVVWATRAGLVRYADADHRRGTAASLVLDACDLLVSPAWRRTIEGLVNQVSVAYGVAPEGGEQPTYTAEAPASITRWGRYAYSASTALAALADAQEMGSLLLARNSQPVWVMAALPIDVAGLDATRYAALLNLEMHSLISLTGLPGIGGAPTVANLWVEGWHETLSWGEHTSSLVVSGYCRTVPPPRWDDVDPAWIWGSTTITERRRNLLPNPSFELGTTGWSAWGSGSTIARQGPGAAPVGSYYLRSTMGASTNAGTVSPAVPATPGVTYGASVRSRLNAAAGVYARLQFLDSGGAQVSIINGATTTHPTGTWGVNTVSGVAPTGATQVRLFMVRLAAGTAGQQLDVDAALVYGRTAGTFDPTYFDGDTLNAGSRDYAWAGAPHASASVESTVSQSTPSGLPPETTWDDAACLGPPINAGRWNDQPANLRWDQVPATTTWQTAT